jgi:outer membrane protein OmpA-like peptidoglycan-associated protein
VSEKQKEKDRDEIAVKLKDSGIDVDTEKRGIVLRMGEVLFDFDSYALRPDVQGKLDRVVDIIREKYPDREIIVEGHTDTTGRPENNMNLSNRRARAVAEYLKPGVGHDKFSYRGFGPDRPISDKSTREGRQKNRRVEIIIKLNYSRLYHIHQRQVLLLEHHDLPVLPVDVDEFIKEGDEGVLVHPFVGAGHDLQVLVVLAKEVSSALDGYGVDESLPDLYEASPEDVVGSVEKGLQRLAVQDGEAVARPVVSHMGDYDDSLREDVVALAAELFMAT